MKIENLGDYAAAAAAKGEAVVEWGGGHWASFRVGSQPARAYWGTALSKSQRQQIATDLAAVGKLAVGQSVDVVRGFHPRHGAAKTTVTRVA